jgi:nucleoid-associated protein YgaU
MATQPLDPIAVFTQFMSKIATPQSVDPIITAPQAAKVLRLVGIPNGTPANIVPPRNFMYWFPVGPTQITKSGTLNRNTFNVVKGGERAHSQGPTLGTISFDSFFPGPDYSGRLCLALRSPLDYVDPVTACALMEYLRDSGSIVSFMFGGDGEINEKVQITDFSWSMVGGQPFHRHFSISLGIWEPEQVKVRGGARLPALPTVYVVREGETLSDVALRMLGDSKKWRDLTTANPKLKPDPKFKLIPGTNIKIPRHFTEPGWADAIKPPAGSPPLPATDLNPFTG